MNHTTFLPQFDNILAMAKKSTVHRVQLTVEAKNTLNDLSNDLGITQIILISRLCEFLAKKLFEKDAKKLHLHSYKKVSSAILRRLCSASLKFTA